MPTKKQMEELLKKDKSGTLTFVNDQYASSGDHNNTLRGITSNSTSTSLSRAPGLSVNRAFENSGLSRDEFDSSVRKQYAASNPPRTGGEFGALTREVNSGAVYLTEAEKTLKNLYSAYEKDPSQENADRYNNEVSRAQSMLDKHNQTVKRYNTEVENKLAELANRRTSQKVARELDSVRSELQKLNQEQTMERLAASEIGGRFQTSTEDEKAVTEANRQRLQEQEKKLKNEYETLLAKEQQELIDSGEYREVKWDWKNLDEVDDALLDAFKRGYYGSAQGLETTKELMGDVSEKAKYDAELEKDNYKFIPRGKFLTAVLGAMEMFGQQAFQLTDPTTLALAGTGAFLGAKAGTMGGAAAGSIGGPLGTGIGGTIGATAGALIGLRAGMATGSARINMMIEAGHAYNEMVEAGVPAETAKVIAMGVGGVNAALEAVQLDELAKSFDALQATGSNRFSKALAKELAKRVLVDPGSETAQEVLQEGSTIAGVQLGSYLAGEEAAYSTTEILTRLKDTAASSYLTFLAMGLPGNVTALAQAGIGRVSEGGLDFKPVEKYTVDGDRTVSVAADPAVIAEAEQANATRAENPNADVKDAATTLYMKEQGLDVKVAQKRADVVADLIAGKKVEPRDINKLEPGNPTSKRIFSQLTGVVFPDRKLSTEELYNLYRSAHDVAVKAEQTAQAEEIVARAIVNEVKKMDAERSVSKTDVAARVAQAQQTVEQAAPADSVVTFEQFAERAKQLPEYANAEPETLGVVYAQFLQDSGMSVEMNGKPVSFAEFVGVLRSAPDGDKLTVGEMGRMFQQLAQRQNMNKEANYGGQNLLHSEGLSGQPDQRSSGQSRGVSETAGRAEGDGGTRRGDQSGSQAGRGSEVRSAGQNQEGAGSYRTVKVNGNPMTEVRPEAYTPEMRGLVDQYASIGVNAHIVIEGYPVDSEGHYADGITIFNTDGTTDVFLQVVGAHAMPERSGHEKSHVVLGRDPAAKEQAIAALGKAMSEKELLELVNAYLPMYGSAYANSEDLIGDLLEEIICDAYANLDRANAGAPKYHDAVSGVIEAQLQSYSASYGQDVTLTDDAGNLVVESDGNGRSTFSMSTYRDSGRDILTQWMGKAVVNGDLTQQDADDIVNTLDLIYDICEEARGDYAPFDAWSEAKVVVNEQGNPVFSVVKANGDYAMNLDFSLVCKKRRTLDAVLNELVKQGFVDNLALNEKQIVKINDLIRSYGFEVACDLCFVDAKRYRQGKVADDFVKLYNDLVQSMIPKGSGLKPAYFNFGQSAMVDNAGLGIHELSDDQLDFTKIEKVLKEKSERSVEYKTAMLLKTSPADRKLTMRGDFLSTRGFDELNLKNPRVLKLFNSKKGSGGPKSAISDVQYLNEVLTSKTFTPEKAYAVGGVRIQSFSDYVPRMVFDYVQMIADLAAKKLPAHAYTKEELFVKQFGLTGMKINMSLIPKVVDGGIAPGLDADGNYAWANESFDFDEAKKIQKAEGYSRNCGTIAVGVSDEHIRKLMADPEIRMVIPYHKSGLNPVVAKMNKINAFVNYTDFQNTRRPNGKNGKKLDKDVAADKKLLDAMPDFNTKMRELGDPRAAAEFYVRWCEENNLLPKFDQFAYKTIDGMPVEKDGKRVVDENYYKLLEDFTVYDKGKYVEQTGLTMTFPSEGSAFGDMKDLILRGLSEDALLEAKRDENIPKIVNDIKQMKFSVAGWKPNLDSTEWDIVKSVMNNGRGTNITSIDKMFFESTKGKSVFGIYSTDDDTLLYASRGEDAVREHQFVEFVKEEFENGGLTDTSTKGIRALAERARMQSVGNSGDNVTVGGSDRLGRYAGLDGRQPRFHASGALENVLTNILKTEESRRANSVTEQPAQASEKSGAFILPEEVAPPKVRYSVTPAFEKWYQETYNEELTNSQLKRRLKTAERRAEQAEHKRKAAELKNTFDNEMNLTAWLMHHTKKMREQKRATDEKLAAARKEKTEAVKAAIAETKEIERAKAEVQHDADRMAERRNAAKRLRIREDAYKQKVTEMKENQKLKRNAAMATLRDSKLAAKRRAEIEAEQGLVDTIRKNPAERSAVERRQKAAEKLRFAGRVAYRHFISGAASIERFSKRQTEGMRADTLVNILGGTASTVESMFKKGLVDRAGNRIGESMSDLFLCWDEAHKKVDEDLQAVLQDFMLHRHNIDRMSIVSRAESALETFENTHEWLRDMGSKEFARLVAMTEKEAEKSGKREAQQQAIQYARLIREYNEAHNKPIFADDKGNPVTAETSQKMVNKYIEENPWLLEKADGIYDWWDKFMREWAVGDTISEAEYERMRKIYPHYVPTYRTSRNGVGGAGFVGNGAASVSKAVKKAKGSTEEVMAIEDSFSNIVSKIVRLNRLNEMYMNIIDTAMLDADGLFSDMAYFDWDWQSGQYGNALVTGSADIVDLTDTVEETEKAGLEKVGDNYKLTAWRDGRKYTAYISEDLYRSMEHVAGYSDNEFSKLFLATGRTLTKPMKLAITGLNPFFAIRNFARDVSTAYVNGISGMKFPVYLYQAFGEMLKNSEHWQQFQALGGTNSGHYYNEKGFSISMAEQPNAIQKIGSGLQWVNENAESATRFAEYLATLDKLGDTYESRLQGIKNAAEVTVDFSRRGVAGKHINAWVPYWNPAVQGVDRLVRSVIDSPDGSKIWKQAAVTLGRAALATVFWEAIQYAVLTALGRRDEWEELDDRTKDTYYCIPLKNEKKFLKIPKNREWGAILGTPFMRMLEWANGREDPFENYIETSIEPNFLPPAILRPDSGGGFATDVLGFSWMNDISKNEDFAGRTIVPQSLRDGSPEYQYDSDSSYFARALGDLFNFSPMQIDYIVEDYFGDFGEMFTTLFSEATLSGDIEAKDIIDIFTGSMFGDARYSNSAVSKYYDVIEELGRVIQDKKNHLDGDAYKESIEYQTEKAITLLYGDEITELNKQVREMPDGPAKDDAKSLISALAAEALQFYEDSMSEKVNNPILTAEYNDFTEAVSKELIAMDSYSDEYRFKPTGSPASKYTDPENKNREYVLTDDQKEYFKQLYRETYDEVFDRVIHSDKYKNAKGTKKAELLEAARDDVLDETKEEFFDWLRRTGVRSTKKAK